MKSKDFNQNIELLAIGAIFALIGSIIGGIMVINATKDSSPHLVISFTEVNKSRNQLLIDVVNVNDFTASGLWGTYDKEQEIPIYNKYIEFSQTSINKGEIVKGVLDLSYLNNPATFLCNDIPLNNSDYLNCGGVTYQIPINVYCKNCKSEDITYLDTYALVSFDTYCKNSTQNVECKSKMSLISFV